MKSSRLIFISILLSLPSSVWASACTNLFPGAAQTTNIGGGNQINFSTCGEQLLSNPSTVLSAGSVINPAGATCLTCVSAKCSASGTPVVQIDPGPFQLTSAAGGSISVPNNATTTIGAAGVTDYGTLTLGTSSTLNFTDHTAGGTQVNVYRISTLTMNANSIVNFLPGDYWIGTLTIAGNGTRNIQTTGNTTRLFINNAVSTIAAGRGVEWNASTPPFVPERLFVFTYGTANTFALNTTTVAVVGNTSGYFYSQGPMTLTLAAAPSAGNNNNGAFTGANITFNNAGNQTLVEYGGTTSLNNVDFGGLCSGFAGVTNYLLEGPTDAVFCATAPSRIRVTAKNNNNTVTGFTGTIELANNTAASGTWTKIAGGGTISATVAGRATYNFVAGDNGTAVFGFVPAAASTVTLMARSVANSLILGTFTVNYVTKNLTITAVSPPVGAPTTAPFASTLIASPSTNTTVFLTAYNGCAIDGGYSGNKNIQFWFDYEDPTTGTVSAVVNGTSIPTTPGATQVVNFTNPTAGRAQVVMRYADVGKLQLHAQQNTGTPKGASDSFVVKPNQLKIIGGGAVGMPGSTSATGNVFTQSGPTVIRAGDPFSATVDAVCDDNTTRTPNYGNEIVPEGIKISSQAPMPLPSGGHNGSDGAGTIGNATAFTVSATPGRFSGNTFSFDEVGSINMIAQVADNDYLGTGSVSVVPMVVGRFPPSYFNATANIPLFTSACNATGINDANAFTYLDQPFSFSVNPIMTITAFAKAGTITQNYTGSLWKLTPAHVSSSNYRKAYYPITVGAVIPALVFASANLPVPAFVDGANGTGTFNYAPTGGSLTFAIRRLNGSNPSPALKAEIQLAIGSFTDLDGTACTGPNCTLGGFNFADTTLNGGIKFVDPAANREVFYHGRLVVLDAIGPETAPQTVTMQTQYYDYFPVSATNAFTVNTKDACTPTFSSASFTPTYAAGSNLSATISNITPFAAGISTFTVTLTDATTHALMSGYTDITAVLGASGANATWLQYAWPYVNPGNLNYTQNPKARITFGTFKGNNRVIFQQEMY